MSNKFKSKLISLLLTLSVIISYGCAKQTECNKNIEHIHLYTSEDGVKRYIFGEDDIVSDYGFIYHKNNKTINIDENNKALYTLISGNDLININNNKDKLIKLTNNLKSYYLFEYYDWKYDKYYTEIEEDDKTITDYHLEVIKDYNWTTDVDTKYLTGKYTINTYVLYGYRIINDENGKLKLDKSEPVRSIQELIDLGYDYISVNLYKIIPLEDYTKDISSEKIYLKNEDGSFTEYKFNGHYDNHLTEDEIIRDELIRRHIVSDSEDYYENFDGDYSYGYDEFEDECEKRLILK